MRSFLKEIVFVVTKHFPIITQKKIHESELSCESFSIVIIADTSADCVNEPFKQNKEFMNIIFANDSNIWRYWNWKFERIWYLLKMKEFLHHYYSKFWCHFSLLSNLFCLVKWRNFVMRKCWKNNSQWCCEEKRKWMSSQHWEFVMTRYWNLFHNCCSLQRDWMLEYYRDLEETELLDVRDPGTLEIEIFHSNVESWKKRKMTIWKIQQNNIFKVNQMISDQENNCSNKLQKKHEIEDGPVVDLIFHVSSTFVDKVLD